MFHSKAWNTDQELQFIRNLGLYSTTGVSRKELLKGYLKGMERRNAWGGVEKLRCVAYAATALAMLK